MEEHHREETHVAFIIKDLSAYATNALIASHDTTRSHIFVQFFKTTFISKDSFKWVANVNGEPNHCREDGNAERLS